MKEKMSPFLLYSYQLEKTELHLISLGSMTRLKMGPISLWTSFPSLLVLVPTFIGSDVLRVGHSVSCGVSSSLVARLWSCLSFDLLVSGHCLSGVTSSLVDWSVVSRWALTSNVGVLSSLEKRSVVSSGRSSVSVSVKVLVS